MAATSCALLFHFGVFLPTLLLVAARRNPFRYYANIVPVCMTSLGTASSAATLPVSISCAVGTNKLSPDIASFVLSLGATINMDGVAICLICATWFLAALHGVTMGVSKLMMTTFLATLCSMGAAP